MLLLLLVVVVLLVFDHCPYIVTVLKRRDVLNVIEFTLLTIATRIRITVIIITRIVIIILTIMRALTIIVIAIFITAIHISTATANCD